MTSTEQNQRPLRRVAIDPVSRVEGHGKVTLLVDEAGKVQEARLHIVEFRGFEKFIQGRPYWELPVIVQRLCGICPVSHHLAAGKAIDQHRGAGQLTPAGDRLRRLLHYGQVLQSHALHFFHLASPDLLFGFEAPVEQRNILAVAAAHPEIAVQGVKLRKYGQEVIQAIAGKKVHGIAAIPGGMNKALSSTEVETLKRDLPQVIAWAESAVQISRDLFLSNEPLHRQFAAVDSPLLSLVDATGALELYDGKIRVSDGHGKRLFDDLAPEAYTDYLEEEARAWSYMKFPYLKAMGSEQGWYRVGPLARVLNCDQINTPRAEQARREFVSYVQANGSQGSLLYHWARMIEALHCAEAIEALLLHPQISSQDLVAPQGEVQAECFGVIEAPRGTLFHHYRIDEQGLVEKANLIVSTTSNNEAMNAAVRQVAEHYLSGHELTETALNQIEVAIRAYDPCLSCATHALGQMPLEVELLGPNGEQLDRQVRGGA